MASQIEMCNVALSHVGVRSRIASLGDATEEARVLNLHYSTTLSRTLRMHDWGFARSRKALVLIEEDPNEEWSYRYQLPANCEVPRRISLPGRNLPVEGQVRWQIESMPDDASKRTILTDQIDALLVYTRNDIPAGVYPEHFKFLFEWNLAQVIAMPLTSKAEIGQYAISGGQAAMHEARAFESNTGQPDDAVESEFYRARL